MSAWIIVTVEPKVGNTPLKIDRQHLIRELQSLWTNIQISSKNDEAATVEWWLPFEEGKSFEGDITFSYDSDCLIIDARSSASYVVKFLHWYREIVPQNYRLSVGNDWGGPEDQFDLIYGMNEIEIHDKIRDWVND